LPAVLLGFRVEPSFCSGAEAGALVESGRVVSLLSVGCWLDNDCPPSSRSEEEDDSVPASSWDFFDSSAAFLAA